MRPAAATCSSHLASTFDVHIARTWDARVTVNLIGGGKESTVLHGNGTDPVIDFSASVAQLETYSDVRDLAIIGSAKTYDGIKLDGNARLRLQNLDIRACAKGIRNLGGLVMAIEACTIQGNNDGLYCRLSAQSRGTTAEPHRRQRDEHHRQLKPRHRLRRWPVVDHLRRQRHRRQRHDRGRDHGRVVRPEARSMT
jgi:hypothetical protein